MRVALYDKKTNQIKSIRTVNNEQFSQFIQKYSFEYGIFPNIPDFYRCGEFVKVELSAEAIPIAADRFPSSAIKPIDIPDNIEEILIVANKKGLGDVKSRLAGIQLLKKRFANMKIGYMGPSSIVSIIENHPDVDYILNTGEDFPPKAFIADLSDIAGKWETSTSRKLPVSREEIYTRYLGLKWENEKPLLFITEEEAQFGYEYVNSKQSLADYHVHIADEDADFNPDNWIEVAKRKKLCIVGTNTHSDTKQSWYFAEELNKRSEEITFIPVVEIEIKDDKRKFHLLCINPSEIITDVPIHELSSVKDRCDKIILAHPKYDFSDFADILDGAETENGRHKCKNINDTVVSYSGSDAHSLEEWQRASNYTEILTKDKSNKENLGVVLRTAEVWKDWRYIYDLIDIAKDKFKVFCFDESLIVDDKNVVAVANHSIREVMSILCYMDCVVSCDTGIHHLCEALDIKCLALFGSMDIGRYSNREFDTSVSFLQGRCPYDKSPCMYKVCGGLANYQPCMDSFSPSFVLRKVEEILSYGKVSEDKTKIFR